MAINRFKLSLIIMFLPTLTWGATIYDQIVVTVNSDVITANEIDLRILQEALAQNQNYEQLKQDKGVRTRITDSIIEEVLLEQRADDLFIQVSEDEIERAAIRFRTNNRMDQKAFEALLEQQQISITRFRANLRDQIRRQQVIEQEVRQVVNIDKEQIKKDFEAKGTRQIRASHILIRVSPQASAGDVATAKAKVLKLKSLIEAGQAFDEVAVVHSEDPSAKTNRGDLGFFNPNQMVKSFADAAYSLPLNQLSSPVRSPFGWHLILVTGERDDPNQSFDQLQEKLYQQAYQAEANEKYRTLIKKLKTKAKISYRKL